MKRNPEKLVSCLAHGMNYCRLYPRGHPLIVKHMKEVISALKTHQVNNVVVFTIDDEGRFYVNGDPFVMDTAEVKKFVLKLRHNNVARITIGKEALAGELKRFLEDIGSASSTLNSYDNIIVRARTNESEDDRYSAPKDVPNIGGIKKLYRDILVYRNIEMVTVDAIVGELIVKIRQRPDILNMPIVSTGDSDDLFYHSANVAMLSILQAEHLGFGNAILFDVGLAAVLHDIGKTLLPKNMTGRHHSLSHDEWKIMKNHPVYGAALLASLKNMPEIAITVAFEHHMKYNGTGYPETRRLAKKQHVISQMVGIADWFCGLRSNLSHRKPLDAMAIIGLLIETAGKEFDPLLVDNFVHAVRGRKQAPI